MENEKYFGDGVVTGHGLIHGRTVIKSHQTRFNNVILYLIIFDNVIMLLHYIILHIYRTYSIAFLRS
jgi:hypothetical protein